MLKNFSLLFTDYPAYFFYIIALCITIKTDFKSHLIYRFVSLYLVPLGWLLSYFQYLQISFFESISASLISYFFLYFINHSYYWIKKHDGMGQGDLDLIAFIASFTGFLGFWFAILIGSCIGTVSTLFYMLWKRTYIQKVPFGAYIAIGSILFMGYKNQILSFFI